MPASVVLVHDQADFVNEATTALEAQGYSVAAFLDPMRALDAMEKAAKVEVLITRMTFSPGKPNGVSLARMTLRHKRGVRIIFIGGKETRDYAEELGAFLLAPVSAAALVEEVGRTLRFTLARLMARLRVLPSAQTERHLACEAGA